MNAVKLTPNITGGLSNSLVMAAHHLASVDMSEVKRRGFFHTELKLSNQWKYASGPSGQEKLDPLFYYAYAGEILAEGEVRGFPFSSYCKPKLQHMNFQSDKFSLQLGPKIVTSQYMEEGGGMEYPNDFFCLPNRVLALKNGKNLLCKMKLSTPFAQSQAGTM